MRPFRRDSSGLVQLKRILRTESSTRSQACARSTCPSMVEFSTLHPFRHHNGHLRGFGYSHRGGFSESVETTGSRVKVALGRRSIGLLGREWVVLGDPYCS